MSAFHADLILTLHLVMFKRGQITAQCRVKTHNLSVRSKGQCFKHSDTLSFEFESWQEPWKNFLLPESTLCADSYSVSVSPCVTKVACKRSQSFWQKCRWQVTPKHAHFFDPTKSEWADYAGESAVGRLHLNTHTSLTQQSQSGLTMLPSMHSVGTNPKTSSHATCKGTFTHRHLSSMSHCGLILA